MQSNADPSLALLSQQPVDAERIGPQKPLSDLEQYVYYVNQGAGTTFYIIESLVIDGATFRQRLRDVSPSLCLTSRCR